MAKAKVGGKIPGRKSDTYVDLAGMVQAIEDDGALIAASFCNPRTRVCGHVGRCAVGALMIAAGVSPRAMRLVGQNNYRTVVEPDVDWHERWMAEAVAPHFGVSPKEQSEIIAANDSFTSRDPVARAEHVVQYLLRTFMHRALPGQREALMKKAA